MTLRSKLIRLAHQNPELRAEILPLLTKQAADFRDMSEAVRRLLKTLRPGKTRGETIKTLALGAVKDPVLMDWFYDIAFSEYGNGRVRFDNLRDAFGEALADWKDAWEISENDPEWDGMSSDPVLLKIIQSAVEKHKPTGAKLSGINWTKVKNLYAGISYRLDQAQSKYAGPDALPELQKWVADLQAALNP